MRLRFLTVGASIVLTGFAALSSPAVAQGSVSPPEIQRILPNTPRMTDRQQEILIIVRSADGYINEELHGEFWSSMPFVGDELTQFKNLLVELGDDVIGPSQRLGYETWHSADLSLKAGRVIRSEGLDRAIEETQGASDIPTYQEKVRSSSRSVDQILSAAANGTPLETANGPIFINDEVISETLAGIEGGARRTEMLLDAEWDPKPQLYNHPDLHISLLADWPYTPSKSTVTLVNGIVSDFWKLEQTVSDTQWVMIGFADYDQAIRTSRIDLSDPDAMVLKNAVGGLKAIGATAASVPRAETWRGYHSAEASGHASDGEIDAYVALRSIYLPRYRGFLVVSTVSLNTLSDAQGLLDKVEKRLQISR